MTLITELAKFEKRSKRARATMERVNAVCVTGNFRVLPSNNDQFVLRRRGGLDVHRSLSSLDICFFAFDVNTTVFLHDVKSVERQRRRCVLNISARDIEARCGVVLKPRTSTFSILRTTVPRTGQSSFRCENAVLQGGAEVGAVGVQGMYGAIDLAQQHFSTLDPFDFVFDLVHIFQVKLINSLQLEFLSHFGSFCREWSQVRGRDGSIDRL
jgi:hypothetical protein